MSNTLKSLRHACRSGLQGSELLKHWEGERGLVFVPLHKTIFKADTFKTAGAR